MNTDFPALSPKQWGRIDGACQRLRELLTRTALQPGGRQCLIEIDDLREVLTGADPYGRSVELCEVEFRKRAA